MIFYIRLLYSGPQVNKKRSGSLYGQACTVSLGFVGLEDMGRRMRFKANTPTKSGGGFQRGLVPPLWHTTLLARCSVLYLPAWLTGEAGQAMRFMSCLDRQKNGRRDCRLGCARMTAGFAERGQGYASYLWARYSRNHFICRKHIEIKDKLLYPT